MVKYHTADILLNGRAAHAGLCLGQYLDPFRTYGRLTPSTRAHGYLLDLNKIFHHRIELLVTRKNDTELLVPAPVVT